MTEADRLVTVLAEIDLLGMQAFTNLNTVTAVLLNRIERLVSEVEDEGLEQQFQKLEPLLDALNDGIWEVLYKERALREKL